MASTSTTSTLRLRMSPVQYRRSRIHASISEAGPSRLPSFSQILDLDMKDLPLSDDQFSFNEQNTPKITTTTAPTRSDNPAAVLRALLSRLPAHPPSPTKSSTEHERESDFDTGSESNASPLDNSDDRLQRTEGLFSTPPTSLRRQNAVPLDNSDDRLQRTEELFSTPPPSLRRQNAAPLDNSDDRLQRTEELFSTPHPSLRRQNAAQLDNSNDRLQRTEELPSTLLPSLRRQNAAPLDNSDNRLQRTEELFSTPHPSNGDDRLQRTEELFSTPPTSLRRQNAVPLDNSDDRLQRTEELSSTPPPSLRRQKSPKSFKIRVLDAFGREQDPDESVEDAVRAASPSHSTVNRGELLSRIRTGLDDLVVGIDDLDK